ncbi:MAG: mechanosensitive ion channel, partial [Candidatus Omnitrophica bacterium]|nr:mechanosensitive ion channel [Candidatus Omnitrophota bacterium]
MDETFTQIFSLIPLWVYALIGLILWVLGLNLVKRFLLKKAASLSKPQTFSFVTIIVEAARFPLTLLILGSGIYLLGLFVPFDSKTQQASNILAKATIIAGIILFLDQAIKEFINSYRGQKLAFIPKGILQGLIRGTVLGIGLLVFMDLIGISITPALASLGIGSLAVALALQDTLANFFAGVYITIDRPIRAGDFIKLESGEEGYVIEVGWRSTRIRTLPNNVIIVPNQKAISSV